MPFQVKKIGDKYKLWKIKEKTFVKTTFNTREAALNQGKNYMRYRGETPVIRGNKIINSKKK